MTRLLELTPDAAIRVRAEITRARGNEVCFIATIDEDGGVGEARAVARGNTRMVLAAVRDAEPGTIVLHNHPSGDLTPSQADLTVAAELYGRGIGMAIVDNDARELYVVVEPPRRTGLELLDEEEIAGVLAPGGPVSARHPAYEDRITQRDMARAVARAYNDGGVAITEAGTGTGKSVAYLVPAIRWSVLNRERTVVSTNTINLQEQLVGKDLPFLRRALGEPFRFSLVKGRHNYVSIRRAILAAQTAPALFDSPERVEMDAIVKWLDTTRDGSIQDLPFEPTSEVWDEVVSDSDVCLRTRCPHFDNCHYQRARRDAASADILVVNHHLLFSDLSVRRTTGNYTATAVLPPYRRVILDEAHNLEDAATAHLGANVTRRGLMRAIGRLDRRGRGVLGAVEMRLKAGDRDLLQQDALDHLANKLRPRVERARALTDDFFLQLETLVRRGEDGVLRLQDDFPGEPEWVDGPATALEGLLLVLGEIARDLVALRERIDMDRRWVDALQEQLVELHGVEMRIRDMAGGLRLAFGPGNDAFPLVRWLERRGTSSREPNVAARAAPVDLSDALRDSLFDRVDTAVLASATLSTRGDFGFIRGRLGLTTGSRVAESMHPSPFDFTTQTVIALVTDLPAPIGGGGFDIGTAAITEDMARLSDGGLFVLFTSYRALRAVAAELRRRGAEGRWPLFVQGEAARAKLLDRFASSGRGILLGVSSFWEGVDVPGDPLRGLIITKLPFKVPSEPLTAARLEAIEEAGGNSFADYMLPHAALRLKQGFGRLIRSRTDRGAVVLLDRRIRERGYGRYFLDTLPPAPVHAGGWQEMRAMLHDFYVTSNPAMIANEARPA